MPDLNFKVTGVEPAEKGLVPLLNFKLEVTNSPETEAIRTVVLQAQIQFQSVRRSYTPEEKERLVELFGTPDRWGQTLRSRLWTHAHASISAFSGRTEATLPVQCTYDVNLASAKYLYGLTSGDVPLLFLFSGSVFYVGPNGFLQVQQISWDKECAYRMPLRVWREMMDYHYPNEAWIYLRRDVFDRLYAYRRREGLATWEQTIDRLIGTESKSKEQLVS